MRRKLIVALLVLLVLGAGALYRFALPGLSSARPTPPAIEMQVATSISIAGGVGRALERPGSAKR